MLPCIVFYYHIHICNYNDTINIIIRLHFMPSLIKTHGTPNIKITTQNYKRKGRDGIRCDRENKSTKC